LCPHIGWGHQAQQGRFADIAEADNLDTLPAVEKLQKIMNVETAHIAAIGEA
jgi:hypothetical protein